MAWGNVLNFPFQHRGQSHEVGSPHFRIDDPLTAIKYLGGKLDTQAHHALKLEQYYASEQPLNFIVPEVREAVGTRLTNLVVNWPALKITTQDERMDIKYFRLPDSAVYADGQERWQRNNMDEQAQQANVDSLLHGRAFCIVWGDDDGKALYSVESPRQCIVYRDPRTRKPITGMKRWVEDDGFGWVVLYGLDAVRTFKSKSSNADTSNLYADPNEQVNDFSHIDGWDQKDEIPNTLGRLPIVPIVNKPRTLQPDGASELDTSTLALSDAVNKLATDMMVTSEFTAAPRRWATGVEIEEDPETGEESENFKQIAGRTWIAEDPAARIGQLPEAGLKNFVEAMQALGVHLAATGSLPIHIVDPSAASMASAEARRAAEAPLIVRVKRRMKERSGAWEEVNRLGALVEGDYSDELENLETVWESPEVLTDAQRMDAASKRKSLGIPLEQVWEDAGYTAPQIENMKKQLWAQEGAFPADEQEGRDGVPGQETSGLQSASA
jgi:hypothetical protein